jgi:hypothetical protein
LPATAWTDVGNLHYFNVCRTRTLVKSRAETKGSLRPRRE